MAKYSTRIKTRNRTDRRHRRHRRHTVLAVSVVLLLATGSACGSSSDAATAAAEPTIRAQSTPATTAPTATTEPPTATEPPATTTESPASTSTTVPATVTQVVEPILPVTVTDETGSAVTVESIERIIPLDGDIAEIVFALGLGPSVVATDLSATYPPEADALPEIGYQRALSAEAVAAFAPTVLLATDVAGPPEALDDMRRLGFPLVVVPNESTSTGAGRKIRAVASALGVPSRGEALAQQVDDSIAAAAVSPGSVTTQLRVIAMYLRGTASQLVLGESSNTRWLIEAAGGIDVSASMGVTAPTPVSAEAILAAAPDVVLVPAAGLASVNGIDGLLETGGLGETPGGRARQVLAYDDQLLLGNGPRTGVMLAQLRDDLARFAADRQPTSDE